MNKSTLAFVALALAYVAVAGCATPNSRIQDHPDIFAQATPDQQAMIREGKVGIGFTPEFVKLAVGEPDRISERTTAEGAETVWHYVESRASYVDYAYADPWFYGPRFAPVVLVHSAPEERDVLRILFKDGKASEIERVVKG